MKKRNLIKLIVFSGLACVTKAYGGGIINDIKEFLKTEGFNILESKGATLMGGILMGESEGFYSEKAVRCGAAHDFKYPNSLEEFRSNYVAWMNNKACRRTRKATVKVLAPNCHIETSSEFIKIKFYCNDGKWEEFKAISKKSKSEKLKNPLWIKFWQEDKKELV